jgi:uncharacterized membrane protein YgcG
MRVFISYRREDTSGQAGRLYDALAEKLGPDNVFMDVDTIDIGVEFKHAIESAVSACDVLFVMIGPRWLTAADSRGERRLSRADDYVRLEVETALGRNIRVVPALVAGAIMPVADDLPGTLAALTLRNAVEMADGPRWQYDVSRLMNLLERIRAGEHHAEAAPPLDLGALPGAPAGLPAAPVDTGLQGGPARHKDETGAPRVAASASHAPVRSSAGGSIAPHSPGAGGVPPPTGGGGGGGSFEGGSGRSGGRKSGGLSDAPRWLVAFAGLGVLALLALALFGAYQLGGDRSAGSPNTQGSTPGTLADTTTTAGASTDSTNVPPNADADQAKLWAAIPKPIRRGSCKFANSEHAGGVATINCDYNDPKHGRTLVHLDRFVDLAHLQVIYKLHGPGSVAAHGGTPDPQLKAATGGCNRTLWRGEGPWGHEAAGAITGPVSGRYSCYQADGQCDLVKKMKLTDVDGSTCSVIVWTDIAGRMFVKAEQQTSVHAGIASFYDFWHHQFG